MEEEDEAFCLAYVRGLSGREKIVTRGKRTKLEQRITSAVFLYTFNNLGKISKASWRITYVAIVTISIKITTDAQYNTLDGKGVIRAICRDKLGNMLTGSFESAIVAEALSVRHAMNLAQNLAFEDVTIESDCLPVVDACRDNIERLDLKIIITGIRSMKKRMQKCGFTRIERQQSGA